MIPSSYIIDKLAFLHIENKRLLLTRSRGNDTFYIPGGKREEGESDQEALIREVKEELSVDLESSTIEFVETFQAQAHEKPEGVNVRMTCYQGGFTGSIQAAEEIEEIRWYEEGMQCSTVTRMIIEWLKSRDLIAHNTLNISRYEWVLFDADETLFRFDDFRGLKAMFLSFQTEFTEEDYLVYKKVNEALWKAYQNHEITIQEIRAQRFQSWAEKLDVSSETLNHAFLVAMSEICEPLEGTISLLNALKKKGIKLGIITNGFTDWQEIRLRRLELTGHIDVLVTSEQVGFAKPHPAIFEHALEKMGNPSRRSVLMIGDNLHSDIKGGIDSNIPTCWFNVHNKPVVADIVPTYQVASLLEIEKTLLFHKAMDRISPELLTSRHVLWAENLQEESKKSIVLQLEENPDATHQY
jgi:5'-nucleotidase